jgi:cellulose biosynthesis protein BcsQ
MGKIVTVMNMKGGVGKTTVALHLAGITATYRLNGKARKVLAIDYDPQFNMSQALLPAKAYFTLEKERKTTLAILIDDDTDLDPYKLQVPGNHTPPKVRTIATRLFGSKTWPSILDFIPSTLDLMHVALGQTDAHTKPIEDRFEKFIAECRSIYDIVIIDCHPAGSIFTKTSLRNSDHVVIPVEPQRYAVRGIGLMMNFIAAKKIGDTGPKPHILFNATPRIGIAKEEAEIRADKNFAKYCMKNTLKRYKAFSEPEGGKGYVWNSSKPYSTDAFRNLDDVASELMKRIGWDNATKNTRARIESFHGSAFEFESFFQ